MISNKSLINAFIRGSWYTNDRNGSMEVRYNHLYSYNTCIAERALDGVIYVNTTKYSPTTSKQQNLLKTLLRNYGVAYREANNLPYNIANVAKYYNKPYNNIF